MTKKNTFTKLCKDIEAANNGDMAVEVFLPQFFTCCLIRTFLACKVTFEIMFFYNHVLDKLATKIMIGPPNLSH